MHVGAPVRATFAVPVGWVGRSTFCGCRRPGCGSRIQDGGRLPDRRPLASARPVAAWGDTHGASIKRKRTDVPPEPPPTSTSVAVPRNLAPFRTVALHAVWLLFVYFRCDTSVKENAPVWDSSTRRYLSRLRHGRRAVREYRKRSRFPALLKKDGGRMPRPPSACFRPPRCCERGNIHEHRGGTEDALWLRVDHLQVIVDVLQDVDELAAE